MARKLRDGLLEPHSIPPSDLPAYMTDTYRGYMVAVKDRLGALPNPQIRRYGFTELDVEFHALQARMTMELIAFAIITFQQQKQPIARGRRSETHALRVLRMIDGDVWPVAVKSEFVLQPSSSQSIPHAACRLDSFDSFKETYGRLGDVLHERQRPRQENSGRIGLEDVLSILDHIRILSSKHYIVDQEGRGWFVDSYHPGMPGGVLIGLVSQG